MIPNRKGGNKLKKLLFMVLCVFLLIGGTTAASWALTLDLIEGLDDPVADLTAALLAPSPNGITIVGGSEAFVGRVGDGLDPNTAQSATYTGLNLVPNNSGLPTISNPDGIFLTSGVGNIPQSNNDTSFDNNSVGTSHPGTGSDTDLFNILQAAGAPSTTTNDVNFFSFDFTVPMDATVVEADFVFGSDEFPDQGVTDVFAFIVDGINYAFFQDGSLVSFVVGVNAANFNDNDVGTGNYDLEYDGISNSLHVVGLLDPALTTHSIKIAIADTSDSIFDSGVFIGNLMATDTPFVGGGIDPAIIPEPTTWLLLGTGLIGLVGLGRRFRKR
jgi:hypothetical protein